MPEDARPDAAENPYLPPFEPAEFDRRIATVRQRMAERGIDVLVLADPANMNYLTGYDGWSFYVHQVVVLHARDETPLWIGRHQDAAGARATTRLPDAAIIGYPDPYVQSDERHPMDFVAARLAERGWNHGTIGVEADAYYYTAAADAALRKGLPDVAIVDAGGLVNRVRAVKSPAEIALMRTAARIAEAAMATAYEAMAPGVRQCDVVAAIQATQIRGLPDAGGDYPAIMPLLPTGRYSGAAHLTWTDRPFVAGEATVVELAGCRRRYHCPLARTIHLGEPERKWRDLAAVVVEGVALAIDAARPGNTAEDVEAAWRRALAKAGLEKESRIGYAVGLNYPPDWGEHTISLRAGDTTVLEPGMTFHLIPAMWLDGWGLEITETILIGETGAEPLCAYERDLLVKA